MIPNASDLDAALRKVRLDYGMMPGVVSIRLAYYKGRKPIIVIKSSVPQRPANLPKFIRSFADASIYPIPILWEAPPNPRASLPIPLSPAKDDMRLNDDMWAGFTTVTPHPMKMSEPGRTLKVPIAQGAPYTTEEEHQFATAVRLPQFATPNFWAKPFHKYANLCCPRYETRTLVYTYTVPSDYLLIVKGLSYEFSDLSIGDQFIMHVLRDANELTRWTDMKANNNPDPATQYVFAGHYRPFPLWARFDHDQTMGIAVTVRGPYPFTKTPSDTLGGCVSVFPQGWLGSLYDNRDGGARPVDLGELNDIFMGEGPDE